MQQATAILLVVLLVAVLVLAVVVVLLRRRLTSHRAELRSASREKTLILQSISDRVTYLDRDLHIVWTNWADREDLHTELPVVPGSVCYRAIAGEIAPCAGCPVPQVLRTGVAAEGVVNCRDGSILRLAASPVRDEQGALVGVVQTARDITEQRHLAERLQHSQKMEAVGQLAAGVAHDFNNGLQVILGYGELLSGELAEDCQERRYLDPVLRAGEQARDVVRQLLTFSRKQQPSVETIDMAERVIRQVDVLRRLVGVQVDVTVTAAPNLPLVTADPSQVEQVLLNLCLNARDAMPSGGRLDITLESLELDGAGARRRGAPAAGTYVVMGVADEGVGVPPRLHDRIFDPFYTTKSLDRGTGLGLATVYGIVRAHHGFVELESAENQGAVFRIGWPTGEIMAAARDQSAAIAPAVRSATVLVVEDDPAVRRLAVSILEREGHQVCVATDGREALDLLLDGDRRFELVIMDVMLPGVNGWAVYRRASERHPDLRVIFCSGYSPTLLESEYQVGLPGQEFLQKPYRPRDLAQRVRKLLSTAPLRVQRQAE